MIGYYRGIRNAVLEKYKYGKNLDRISGSNSNGKTLKGQ